VEAILAELVLLKSLYFHISREKDEMICDALIGGGAIPIRKASVDPPKVFCPQLEEITSSLDEERVKALIRWRREAGVPLRRVRHIPKGTGRLAPKKFKGGLTVKSSSAQKRHDLKFDVAMK
jgi:hypothetical protein